MRKSWTWMVAVVVVAALFGGAAAVLGLFDATEMPGPTLERNAVHDLPTPGDASPSEEAPSSREAAPHENERREHTDETQRPADSPPESETGPGQVFPLLEEGHIVDEDALEEDPPAQRHVIRHGGLRGRVLDSDGEPVVGERVEITMHNVLVEDEDGEQHRVTKRDFTLTGADGGFRFEGLQALAGPSYTVRLAPELEGALPAVREVEYLPDDEVLDVGTLWLRVEAVLHGRVLDRRGRAVRGARVVVEYNTGGRFVRGPRRPPGYMLRALGFTDDHIPVRVETTDANGEFRFEQLDAIRYDVRAQADGHRDSVVHSVTLEEGKESEPLTVQLRRALSLEVQVRDVLGSRVEEAQVTARLMGPQHRDRDASTQSARVGVATFRELADILVVLSVEARGYLPTEVVATLDPSKISTQVQVTLTRAAGLHGRLVDSDGEPLAEEPLWLRLHTVQGLLESQTHTDEQGRFEFSELEPVPATLEARHTRFGPYFLKAGESRDVNALVLPRTGTLAVYVRDGAGQPVARARVEVQALDASRKTFVRNHSTDEATTGEDGHAELALSAGTYAVRVVAHGFAAQMLPEPLVVDAEETQTLRVDLTTGGGVRGTVLDERGRALPELPVQLIRKGGPHTDWVREVSSDREGRFEFTHVAPGIYRVRAASAESAPARPFLWFEVREGEVEECELTVREQTATLFLALRNRRESATLTLAELRGFDGAAYEGHVVLARQHVQRSGSFQNLPVGRTLVAFVSVDPNAAPLEFTLGKLKPGSNSVTLEMQGTRRVHRANSAVQGVLSYRGENRPVAGARLRLQGTFAGSMQPVRHTTSDRHGYFRVEGLLPGDYRITVTAPGLAAGVHEVKVGNNDEVEVHIEIDDAGYLLFAVHVEAPAPGVFVRATATVEGRAATHTQTAQLGELLIFSNLHRNEIYEIHITADYHGTYRDTYLVRAGDTSVTHITLKEE